MFTMLKRKAPDINITDYITFHSLKSWGIINNKVVSDQVNICETKISAPPKKPRT